MITNSNIVAIIADDLTGANDTALQFKNNGADTNILLDKNVEAVKDCSPRVWAISTETRNVEAHIAFEKVKEATELFVDKYNPDFFYKKIEHYVLLCFFHFFNCFGRTFFNGFFSYFF